MTDCENPITYYRNVHNFDITITKDTNNSDRILIVLNDSINKLRQFSHVKLLVDILVQHMNAHYRYIHQTDSTRRFPNEWLLMCLWE